MSKFCLRAVRYAAKNSLQHFLSASRRKSGASSSSGLWAVVAWRDFAGGGELEAEVEREEGGGCKAEEEEEVEAEVERAGAPEGEDLLGLSGLGRGAGPRLS